MQVPFLDLKTQYNSIREEIGYAITNVLDSGQYILGPEIQKFEAAFASAHNAQFGIATSNGTSALHLALWALEIKPGDEVIVPANTFIATAEAVLLCGATPVFVDHDEFYNLDIDQVEARITRRTRAILAVHLYGQPARLNILQRIAERYGVHLIEDAAQAHLATFQGRPVGSWGVATGFSFYPGKNLGAYGEGGAVVTSDAALAEKMRILRDHGSVQKYTHVIAGHNYRLEALQGAILNVKLRYLARWTEARRTHAETYTKVLADVQQIALPAEHPDAKGVYHLFVVQAERRSELQQHLKSAGIDTGLHYPVPLHLQPCFQNLGYKEGAFPRAERSAQRILSLPMYPELTEEMIGYVGESIKAFYA